jgi:asparaginyl-tRNA synthetase
MLEVEMLGVSYKELADFIETFIIFLLKELSILPEIRRQSLLQIRLETLLKVFPLQRVTYEIFVQKLRHAGGYDLKDGIDLSDVDYIISKYINSPVFVVDYPRTLASWTASQKENGSACALNLILPETYGELCEGCERTNDVNTLRYKIECANIANLQWYLDAVDNMHAPRCGFGLGVDRLVRWIVDATHIRDTVLFPRMKLYME